MSRSRSQRDGARVADGAAGSAAAPAGGAPAPDAALASEDASTSGAGGRTASGAVVAVGFGLYRFAVSRLYGSGMGATDVSVGFVSNVPFVLSMNASACLAALAALLWLRRRGFARRLASPWAASALLLVGVALGAALGGGAAGSPAVDVAQGVLCGVGLFILSIVWYDVFMGEPDASRMLAQLASGVVLYTALDCATAGLPSGVRTGLAVVALAASALLVSRARRGLPDTTALPSRVPRGEAREALPVYLGFFVLVGVVGIMHTSVLGTSSEYIMGVPMWLVRVASAAVFLAVVLPQGARFNMTAVLKAVFAAMVAVLTLLPFLGSSTGSLTGSVAIACYCVCGMLIYIFIIREGRKLGVSSVLLACTYTLGSSGFLFCGLCIGLALRAFSAGFGASLLTLLAFVAIYPLVLGLMFLQRRGGQGRDAGAGAYAGGAAGGMPGAPAERPGAPEPVPAGAADAVAQRCGLTKREREVLSYLASGASVRYIAEALVISENTAWTHVKRIYAKTGTHGREELDGLLRGEGQAGKGPRG